MSLGVILSEKVNQTALTTLEQDYADMEQLADLIILKTVNW